MFYLPVIGAFFDATGMILTKKILKNKFVNNKIFTFMLFLGMVIVMLPLIYFFWKFDINALQPINIAIFIAIIITSIFANLLIFYSLKKESINEIEPVILLQPLMTILIAYFLSFFFIKFANEGNIKILGLALIASIALITSHIKKHHIVFDKYILAAIIGSLMYATEMVLSRFILEFYSPISFFFIRCLLILIVITILYKPSLKKINNKIKLLTLVTCILGVSLRSIVYYGYENLGVIFTTTLFILSPVLIHIMAVIYLKEKMEFKNILATIVILACVVASIFIK
ncbi:DMT family transporter [Candidatus Pacearchaeota archaeon]|nr:DMT family transporter [Candidatus Pacearchaeota archaeon]